MKVKDLIELLQLQDPEDIVVLSKDAEGNDFSPLEECSISRKYIPETTWSGAICFRTAEEALRTEEIEDLEDFPEEGINCIVLWPVN